MSQQTKMNPEVKVLWLEALRSDKYKQCREKLCKINEDGSKSYCCLGVLSQLAIDNGVDVSSFVCVRFTTGCLTFSGGDEKTGSLVINVCKWAGLSTSEEDGYGDPIVNYDGRSCSLSELNDSYRLTFKEIADLIEEQL